MCVCVCVCVCVSLKCKRAGLLGLTPASEELSKLQGNQSPAAHLEEDSDEFYESVDEEDAKAEEKNHQLDQLD